MSDDPILKAMETAVVEDHGYSLLTPWHAADVARGLLAEQEARHSADHDRWMTAEGELRTELERQRALRLAPMLIDPGVRLRLSGRIRGEWVEEAKKGRWSLWKERFVEAYKAAFSAEESESVLAARLQVAERLIQRYALDEGYRWTGRRFEPADLTEAETDLLDRLSRYV